MAFQGSLDSVNLGDIFQTLAMNRQTGTLSVQGPGHSERHIWFDQGEIAIVDGRAEDGGPLLLQVLTQKGAIQPAQAEEIRRRLYQTRQNLRQLIVASNVLPTHDLDDIAAWCIEEAVCELFEWNTGDFTFYDGPPASVLQELEITESGDVRLQTTSVMMEATRRKDEWQCIWQIIPSENELYIVDNEGRANLRDLDPDPEELKVLRYLDGKHTVDTIAKAVGVSRFDAYAIVARLVQNGVARARSPQDIVADALALRDDGKLEKARDLLENAAGRMKVAEVLRPLAEIYKELGDTPSAVELHLDLIQQAQDDGDLEQALADLNIVTTINPDDPDLQLERADVLLELHRNDEAAAGFIRGAENYLASRETKLAVDACHRAKDLQPANPDPHRLLAKAYLFDNQIENAVVEYKSLWHTLLSNMRPRKALEELERILRQDCKFPRVSEQVLNHARGSEAVKTGSAIRRLIYVLILLILGGAGYYTYKHIIIQQARQDERERLRDLRGRFGDAHTDPRRLLSLRRDIIAAHEGVESHLGAEYEALLADVRKELEQDIAERRKQVLDSIAAAESPQALEETDRAIANFAETFDRPEAEIRPLREALAERRAVVETAPALAEIEERWSNHAWDAALAELEQLVQGVPAETEVADRLRQQLRVWRQNLASSAWLYERGRELERASKVDRALMVYRRAMDTADGDDTSQGRARAALIELERRKAEAKLAALQAAIKDHDRPRIFDLLSELEGLLEQFIAPDVKQMLDTVELPYTVVVDDDATRITVERPEAGTKVDYEAEADTDGSWSFTLAYKPGETVVVRASRTGFRDERLSIRAERKQIEGKVELTRAPKWQRDLGARAVVPPVAIGNKVAVLTEKPELKLIDTDKGNVTTVMFPNVMRRFEAPIFVRSGVGYMAIAGQLYAVDLRTGKRKWHYPEKTDFGSDDLGTSGIWVQQHPQKLDELLVYTGTQKQIGLGGGAVVALGIRDNQPTPYEPTAVRWSITGAPIAHRNVLYVPAGTHVLTFVADSVGLRSPLEERYTHQVAGEILCAPFPARVGDRDAVLITDSTGWVVALDADPGVSARDRVITTWVLGEGSGARFTPTYDPDARRAYVALADKGRIMALDLSNTEGRIAWTFPADAGSLGALPGPPAIGRLGIYSVNEKGDLYCIDAASGEKRWSLPLNITTTAGLIAHDGSIFVPAKASLLCFEEGEP